MADIQNDRDKLLQAATQRMADINSQAVTLIGRNVNVVANSLIKTAPAAWDGDGYSVQSYEGAAYASGTVPNNTGELAFGLNTDPESDLTQNSLDYAWHLHADGTMSIIESGNEITIGGGTIPGGSGGSGGTGGTGSTGGGTSDPPPPTPAPSTTPILYYYGDGYTAGFDGSAYVTTPVPEYVDGHTGNLTVTNEGVVGNTTTRALDGTDGQHASWATQMANSDATWVIIALGFNDAASLTTTAYRSNLRSLYDIAVAAGKSVIFQTVHYVDPALFADREAYVDAMKAEATAIGIDCFDLWTYTETQFTGDIRTWLPDGKYPTQTSYNIISSWLTDQIVATIPDVTGAGGGETGGGGGAPSYPQSGTIAYWGDEVIFGLDGSYNNVATPPTVTFDNDLSNFTVTNEGVSDNTTTRCLAGTDTLHTALTTWLAAHARTYFICQLGMWDHYIDSGITTTQYQTNLEDIVDAVRAAGQIIIFETFNETNIEGTVAPYRAVMNSVATAKSVPVIDQFTYLYNYRIANGLSVADMFPNGYHPTQAVYTMKGHYGATRFKEIIGAT